MNACLPHAISYRRDGIVALHFVASMNAQVNAVCPDNKHGVTIVHVLIVAIAIADSYRDGTTSNSDTLYC
jgi:hypothetical protein